MSRRAWIAAGVLGAWIVGMAVVFQREYLRPDIDRLAEAAVRVSPGAMFYAVMQGTRQVGFASSTIDTTTETVVAIDYFVADIPVGGRRQRATAQSRVTLSRSLRLQSFDVSMSGDGAPLRSRGAVEGDSVLVVEITSGGEPPDSQRIALTGPILLPTLVPVAVALTDDPRVGRRVELPIFDPLGLEARQITIAVEAETSFVLDDSAVFDPAAQRWRGALPMTVTAWRMGSEGEGGLRAWVDAQGRLVQASHLGFDLIRRPYEEAFVNWRMASEDASSPVAADEDILETTAIAARQLRAVDEIRSLTVRLTGADLTGFELASPRQTMRGDTLTVVRDGDAALRAAYDLSTVRRAGTSDLLPEPLIQSSSAEIVALARRLRGGDQDPRVVAERINRWVHDSLAKEIRFGIPSAVEVLRSRRGDCNEHTQLFVALARAAGIRSRAVAGLAYVNGKFYYHAWPEIYLADWVAVDPTFGQFPADGAHLRFVVGGLARQAELLRLIGLLDIDVLAVNK